ncbi:unnamed protein product, partial [Ranitomeya imitator]
YTSGIYIQTILVLVLGGSYKELCKLSRHFNTIIPVKSKEEHLEVDLTAPFIIQGNKWLYGCITCSNIRSLEELKSLSPEGGWDAKEIAKEASVDSGAEGHFVSSAFVLRHTIPLVRLYSPVTVRVVNGYTLPVPLLQAGMRGCPVLLRESGAAGFSGAAAGVSVGAGALLTFCERPEPRSFMVLLCCGLRENGQQHWTHEAAPDTRCATPHI